jgi:hypothetical protein
MPMKRIWGFVFGGLVFASMGGFSLSACAHDDSTIFVQSVLAPQIVAPGTGCSYTNDPTQPAIDEGFLDIAVRPSYTAAFLLANQLVPRGDPAAPKTETSYVTIKGAIVQVTDAATGAAISPEFTSLASVVIPPAQGNTPGYSALPGITLIPEMTVANLGALFNSQRNLLVYAKFFGDTLGGQYVESDNFQFPVSVCNGCLISFSISDVSPLCSNLNCMGNSAAMAQTAQVPCNGEDFPIDCQACLGSPICNPTCILKDAGAPTATPTPTPTVDAGDEGG